MERHPYTIFFFFFFFSYGNSLHSNRTIFVQTVSLIEQILNTAFHLTLSIRMSQLLLMSTFIGMLGNAAKTLSSKGMWQSSFFM